MPPGGAGMVSLFITGMTHIEAWSGGRIPEAQYCENGKI